jgi:hypothetical protein
MMKTRGLYVLTMRRVLILVEYKCHNGNDEKYFMIVVRQSMSWPNGSPSCSLLVRTLWDDNTFKVPEVLLRYSLSRIDVFSCCCIPAITESYMNGEKTERSNKQILQKSSFLTCVS